MLTMQSNTLNLVQSLNTAGASRVQIGNTYNTIHNYQRDIDHDDDKKLLQALRSTDPRQDKVRIEQTNNHLLRGSYMWILENSGFLAWRDEDHESRLLWIRGDPGKGKTMLLCGIINELLPSTRLDNQESRISLSYFFCQATNPDLSNATTVLRGLTYLLLIQQPSLLCHLRDVLEHDPCPWDSRAAMEGLFRKIVADPATEEMYLIVDALDECLQDSRFLLEIISSPTPRVKWIVSSRNRYEIEEYLESSSNIGLSLELHEESVCQAVRYFIDYRTRQLAQRKKLKIDLARKVQNHLTQYAQGTFLWVALVCERLERCLPWEISKILLQFPKGLTELYARMLEEIRMSESCELYIRLLALASTVFRPLTFSELMAMEQLEQLEQLDLDEEKLPDAIKECGSFLTRKEQTIGFIHQSARDFLLKESGALLFPSGLVHHHYTIFQRSINMLESLHKDMYGLEHPGASLGVAIRNRPEPDPLDSLRYVLVFWYDHIRESYELSTREGIEVEKPFVETIYEFFSKKILFWIEALSLCHNLSVAGKTLLSLRDMPAVLSHPDLRALIEDAIRFLLLFGPVIEDYPLQTYASGLLFSPNKSLIRRIFNQYTPDFIARSPRVEEDWSPVLSVFEVSQGTKIRTMSFSRTSKMLALTISNSQLLIWNVSDGSVLRRSKYENATLLTPSPDLRCLASIIMSNSNDTKGLVQYALELRDLDSNNILWARTLDNREALVMEFAPDGKWLAVCYREELRLYTRQGEAARSWGLQLGPHAKHSDLLPWCLTFSTDCAVLLLRYYDEQNKLAAFDLRTGMQYGCPDLIDEDSDDLYYEAIEDANFIPGTHQVMICGNEMGVYLWDVFKGECREWFMNSNYGNCLAFSHTDPWLFIASHGCLLLLDRHQKSLLHDVELPNKKVLKSIQVSYDGKQIAVCSSTTVWLLEVDAILANKPGSDRQEDGFPYISNNGTSIAHYDFENTIEMENQMTGVISTLNTKGIVRGLVNSMAFSPDGQLFAFSDDSSLYVWNLDQASLRHRFRLPARAKHIGISSGESADGQWVAVCTAFEVLVWDVNTGQFQRSIQSPDSLGRHPDGACFAGTRLGVSWYLSAFQCSGKMRHEIFVLYDIKTGQHHAQLNLPCSWTLLDAPGGTLSLSPNGKWVVSYVFERRRLLLSDVERGIQCAVIDTDVSWFSFTDDVTLMTEKGVIYLDRIFGDLTVKSEHVRRQKVQMDDQVTLELPVIIPTFDKYSRSAHCEWITLNDRPLLWLPKQYRLGTQDYWGLMAIGHHHVTIDCSRGLYYILFANDAGDHLLKVMEKLED